ncbi:G elongation factor, mitochondrial 2 [Blomia tropicalis]|nr:G elongation factor, mitochondrial 2 [Blomia tropicalis]
MRFPYIIHRLSVKKFNSTTFVVQKNWFHSSQRCHSKLDHHPNIRIDRIRNIGIVAHIDAGKTTTTERMLFYSGTTSSMGEVHDGDTVMDWMAQERERGITITSATATINWNGHKINLIDTPGHVDFTFEVERSLSVLDSVIVLLDGSAGVQAQTIKVWQQAKKFKLPRMIYLNKMDKPNASFKHCIQSISRKLSVEPIQLHIPISNDGQFIGLIDVVTGRCYVWPNDQRQSNEGKKFFIENLLSSSNEKYSNDSFESFLETETRAHYLEQLQNSREHLIGQLCDIDSSFAEKVLEVDCLSSISTQLIHQTIRKACIQEDAIPVLVGSSYRNIGVQPLLDSIVRYLPSPDENSRAMAIKHSYTIKDTESPFAALAFKIVTDRRLGSLTYLRVYSGTLPPSSSNGLQMYNLNRNSLEKITRIYRPFANQFSDISKTLLPNEQSPLISFGDIIVVSGLTSTITGDTLIDSKAYSSKTVDEQSTFKEILAGVEIPEPVYYCSLESPSTSQMKQLELALLQLQREDPSFKVLLPSSNESGQTRPTIQSATNQIVIKGMGELHIDIIRDRICREFGIDVRTGPLQISYQESIQSPSSHKLELSRTIGSTLNHVNIAIEIRPLVEKTNLKFMRKKELKIKIVNTKDNNLSGQLRPWHQKWIHDGVFRALEYGPLFGFPVVNVDILLHEFTTTNRTTQPFVTNAVTQCVTEALERSSSLILLEPVMRLEIDTPEQYVGAILSDLSNRRCEFATDLDDNDCTKNMEDDFRRIIVYVPLAELGNYSTVIRTITSGMASFDMAIHSYRSMDMQQTERTIRSISGVDY